MVETTYLTRWPVEILSVELTEWQGMRAFSFTERWTQGPAHVLVVQGPDLWLYLLRVRTLDGEAISPLLRDIQATFQVGEPE